MTESRRKQTNRQNTQANFFYCHDYLYFLSYLKGASILLFVILLPLDVCFDAVLLVFEHVAGIM